MGRKRLEYAVLLFWWCWFKPGYLHLRPRMPIQTVTYNDVARCPLCRAAAVAERGRLQRAQYYFGGLRIPLPNEGIRLLECEQCTLLFKDKIPTVQSVRDVYARADQSVWKAKSGRHPALDSVMPYLGPGSVDILDIGASNGDLLRQLARFSNRLSALDVEHYVDCAEALRGEYIIGDLDGSLRWSRLPYDIVMAFDVLEHVSDARAALINIASLVKRDGVVIIETGDWHFAGTDLGRWYYANLFEHHVFWTQASLKKCEDFGLTLERYSRVAHKGRRAMSSPKKLAIRALLFVSGLIPRFPDVAFKVTGRDPSRFGEPSLKDHAFAVLHRTA